MEIRDLGRMRYADALAIQQELVEQRKRGLIPDQLLFVEHPHVVTQGRNGHAENLLASDEALRSAGIEFYPTNRGGDITYHGPGQIVGYPIVDLREWKRDVVAYVRAIEQVIIDALAEFGTGSRTRSGLHRRVDRWQEGGRNRRAYQPLGHLAWFCVESYYGFTLLSVHRSLWVNEAGHFHAGTGIGRKPRRSDRRVVDQLRATISAEPRP